MSANDGIYIGYSNVGGEKLYCVAYASAIGNLDYYQGVGGEELAFYVQDIWGKRGVFFRDLEKAKQYADSMHRECDTEYGVVEIGDLGASPF